MAADMPAEQTRRIVLGKIADHLAAVRELVTAAEGTAYEAGLAAGRAAERERIIAEARSVSATCPGCDVFAAFVVDLIQARNTP